MDHNGKLSLERLIENLWTRYRSGSSVNGKDSLRDDRDPKAKGNEANNEIKRIEFHRGLDVDALVEKVMVDHASGYVASTNKNDRKLLNES